MNIPFKELPYADQPYLRPIIDVGLAGQHMKVAALADTGSLHNRFGRWIADAIGLDLALGVPSRLAVAGVIAAAITLPVELELGDWTWTAPVSFCEPWPFGFQLLGQEGFFRFHRVLVVTTEDRLEVDFDPGGQ